jgi:hypothetical protein
MTARKLIISFWLLILGLFIAPLSAFAQTASSSAAALAPTTYNLPPAISPTSPLYTDLLVNNMFHTFSCLAIGQSIIGQPCLTYQLSQNAQGMIQGIPVLSQTNLSGGTLGAVTSVIGMLYTNPPVRSTDYLASIGTSLGIAKEAKAQGVGGSGAAVLNPILNLWKVSRNISYVILILIFLVIGLMVMFRNKINPQTVITAQTALPGLVIGLVMITFSYFFAGLISDLAFVGTNIVGYYFTAAQDKLDVPVTDPEAIEWKEQLNLTQKMSTENSLSIFSRFVGIVTQEKAQDVLAIIYNRLGQAVRDRVNFLAGLIAYQFTSSPAQQLPIIGQFVGPLIGSISAGVTANNPTAILGMIVAFIAMFILIYAMLKLLLRLVNCYLTIIFLTLTAPFQLLIAALPGRQGNATNWMLNILANVLVFPTVLAVFYFVAFILGQSFGPLKVAEFNQSQSSFIPVAYAQDKITFVGKSAFPLFGGIDLSFINIILAFAALVALPGLPDIVVRSIGKMGQAGQLIGQEISGGIRSGQGYAGRVPGMASGTAQSLGTGIAGESSYFIDGGVVKRFTTKPGLIHSKGIGSLIKGGGGAGGPGR